MLTDIIDQSRAQVSGQKSDYTTNYKGRGSEPRYRVFAEQYLEKPAEILERTKAGFSVTACTVKGIPTIDDW